MSSRPSTVVVIGGGLAGSEAAWQAAKLGVDVTLYEMRPERATQAHKTDLLAELVCSNSFKSDRISNANGLLKLELRMLGSLLMEVVPSVLTGPCSLGRSVARSSPLPIYGLSEGRPWISPRMP